MKTLVLERDSSTQLATFAAAARPWVEGPAVTLAVLLALVLTLTLATAVEAVLVAALLLGVVLVLAAAFFFVVGLVFLIVHPVGDLFLILYLVWLLYAPRAGDLQQPLSELS